MALRSSYRLRIVFFAIGTQYSAPVPYSNHPMPFYRVIRNDTVREKHQLKNFPYSVNSIDSQG